MVSVAQLGERTTEAIQCCIRAVMCSIHIGDILFGDEGGLECLEPPANAGLATRPANRYRSIVTS